MEKEAKNGEKKRKNLIRCKTTGYTRQQSAFTSSEMVMYGN